MEAHSVGGGGLGGKGIRKIFEERTVKILPNSMKTIKITDASSMNLNMKQDNTNTKKEHL